MAIVLKYCTRLKSLVIQECHRTSETIIFGTGNEWLHHQYPSLVYSGVCTPATSSWPELKVFFERNSNIQSIGLNCTFLFKNGHLIRESNLKFKRLIIDIDHDWNVSDNNFVNELYERGFYEMLRIYNHKKPSVWGIQHLITLSNVKNLSLPFAMNEDFPIPVVESIETMNLSVTAELFQVDILKAIAINFINLRKIILEDVNNLLELRPFVCHAPKLAIIHLIRFEGNHIEINDLIALNEERQKLAGAHKIEIIIGEKLFLKLKWSASIKFSMIEVKRRTETVYVYV